jgi:hypothetical protein
MLTSELFGRGGLDHLSGNPEMRENMRAKLGSMSIGAPQPSITSSQMI